MNDFFKGIGSLYWWLSVVVVGILINLASAYLKPKIDSYLLSFSSRWQSYSKKRVAEENDLIEKLANDRNEEILYALAELRHTLGSAISLAFGVALLFFWL